MNAHHLVKILLCVVLLGALPSHRSFGQILPEWISAIVESDVEVVCKFESSESVFFVLRTLSEIIAAERIFVTDGNHPPDNFSVGWKLFAVTGRKLYLDEPEKTISHEVINNSDGFFVQHLTSYKPLSGYNDPIRIELRFKSIQSTSQDTDFSSLPLLGNCTVPWNL